MIHETRSTCDRHEVVLTVADVPLWPVTYTSRTVVPDTVRLVWQRREGQGVNHWDKDTEGRWVLEQAEVSGGLALKSGAASTRARYTDEYLMSASVGGRTETRNRLREYAPEWLHELVELHHPDRDGSAAQR
jgi:hypothetical protein